MFRPNFYVDIDAINAILDLKFDKSSEENFKDLEISLEVVELPYYFIYSANEDNQNLKVFSRGELHRVVDNGIQCGDAEINKKTGEGKAHVSSEIGNNAFAIMECCHKISQFIQINDIVEKCMELDPDKSGIMFYEEEGELKFKYVSGRERPSLMCSRLFGEPQMGRPYMDEVIAAWEREEMNIEEKRAAAEAGDVDCMSDLAMYYLDEEGENEENLGEAIYWFTKMAENGNSFGMYNLGLFYAKGYGVERDFEKAVLYMEQAANSGDKEAPDLLKIFNRILKNAKDANSGNAIAQAELADAYMIMGNSINLGDPKADYKESVKWAKKAVSQNCANGVWVLALAYEHGRGVRKNMVKAIELYRQGADLGHSGCMNNLGQAYMEGEYVERNRREAFRLFNASAELGYGIAMYNVGRCYQFAYGTKGNMKTAVEWFEKALEIIDDPELERKTETFKMMADVDPEWGKDYDEADDE